MGRAMSPNKGKNEMEMNGAGLAAPVPSTHETCGHFSALQHTNVILLGNTVYGANKQTNKHKPFGSDRAWRREEKRENATQPEHAYSSATYSELCSTPSSSSLYVRPGSFPFRRAAVRARGNEGVVWRVKLHYDALQVGLPAFQAIRWFRGWEVADGIGHAQNSQFLPLEYRGLLDCIHIPCVVTVASSGNGVRCFRLQYSPPTRGHIL
jgi:hypothetical protein